MIKPNVYIIGFPKTGTTSLANYLSKSKEVFLSMPKEPLFWSDDFQSAPHEPKIDTIENYTSLFEKHNGGESVFIDASTRYIFSQKAIKRIILFNRESKFIVGVRDPIKYIQSYHMEMLYSLFERENDFQKAWNRPPSWYVHSGDDWFEKRLIDYKNLIDMGQYLCDLFDTVADEKVYLYRQEDFVKDPRKIHMEVLDFLELEKKPLDSYPVSNPAHVHRSRFVSSLVLNPPAWAESMVYGARQFLRENNNQLVVRIKKYLNKPQSRPDLDDEFIASMYESSSEIYDRLNIVLRNQNLSPYDKRNV